MWNNGNREVLVGFAIEELLRARTRKVKNQHRPFSVFFFSDFFFHNFFRFLVQLEVPFTENRLEILNSIFSISQVNSNWLEKKKTKNCCLCSLRQVKAAESNFFFFHILFQKTGRIRSNKLLLP